MRRVFRLREQALGRELDKVTRERSRQDAQANELRELLTQYRDQHQDGAPLDVQQALRLRRFYEQITQTLRAHGEVTERLAQAERIQREAYLGAYRRRLGVDKLIDKRTTAAAEQARRRNRRAGSRLRELIGNNLQD